MGRLRRVKIPGLCHHVIQRGTDRVNIFRNDLDFDVFGAMLLEASTAHRTEIHVYVFMSNHVHLLMTPRIPCGVEKTMHAAGSRYVRYFNKRYGRTGTLVEGRYRPAVVHDEQYWLSCARYIELNPVRAGIASSPEAYCWSSYRANAFGQRDDLVTPHPVYLGLGATPAERQDRWRTVCAETTSQEDLDRLRFAIRQGRALGPIVLPASE